MEEVDQEAQFQEEVEWDELQDDARELVDDVECTEAHPVRKPLRVVIFSIRLKSNETHEGGVGNTHYIGDIRLSDAKHNEQHCSNEAILHQLS